VAVLCNMNMNININTCNIEGLELVVAYVERSNPQYAELRGAMRIHENRNC